MTLHDIIQDDAINVFCNTDDFAETVTYYSRNGDIRDIDVIVVRDAISVFPEDGDTVSPVFQVYVANDATLGIASTELNLGGDYFEFSTRSGQDVSRHHVMRLIEHDEGMLILECR